MNWNGLVRRLWGPAVTWALLLVAFVTVRGFGMETISFGRIDASRTVAIERYPEVGAHLELPTDGINRRRYLTVSDARADVFDYIEGFHNPRIQRRLDSRDRGVSTLSQPSAQTG